MELIFLLVWWQHLSDPNTKEQLLERSLQPPLLDRRTDPQDALWGAGAPRKVPTEEPSAGAELDG